jgi:hypothetical protein
VEPVPANLTAAWPRLVAHAVIVVALGATWALPRSHPGAPPVQLTAARLGAPATTPPLQEMAQRARLTASLPVAGAAIQAAPAPLPTSRSTPPRPGRPARASVVSPQAATYSSARPGWGNDISWPQCDGAYPSGPHDIGVVGVTDGRPFTTNPCLGSQFAWARGSQMPGGAQAYVNLEIDGSSAGPHHCAADDHHCRAYDYGVLTMYDAMARAQAVGVTPAFWWLDVEVGNNWSDLHPEWNQATVQGAIDAVRARGVDVGIYSSVDQWAEILPDAYRPGVPTWLAVVGDSGMAPALCGLRHSLTGGPVYLVQYDDHQFDKDHVCAEGAAGFAAAAAQRNH